MNKTNYKPKTIQAINKSKERTKKNPIFIRKKKKFEKFRKLKRNQKKMIHVHLIGGLAQI